MIAIELGCKKQVKRALHRAPFLYETTVLLPKSTGLTYATADPACNKRTPFNRECLLSFAVCQRDFLGRANLRAPMSVAPAERQGEEALPVEWCSFIIGLVVWERDLSPLSLHLR